MTITNYISVNDTTFTEDGLLYGSYLSTDNAKLLNEQLSTEKYYFGTPQDDLLEVSIFNTNNTNVFFARVVPEVSYTVLNGSYLDINSNIETYNLKKPFTNLVRTNDVLLINTQDILVNTITSSDTTVYVLYNFLKNVAGNTNYRLLIKEISPSRTELRLSFAYNTTESEEAILTTAKVNAFANKKYLFLQLYDLIKNIIYNNPIHQSFNNNKENFNYYEIAYLLGFKDLSQLQEYIERLYLGYDYIKKTTLLNESLAGVDFLSEESILIGISKHLDNFCKTNSSGELTKEEILYSFKLIVSSIVQREILKKTSLNKVLLDKTINFFLKIIYTDWLETEINNIISEYDNRFFTYYKNAINFGDGVLIKILNYESYLNPVDNKYNFQIKLDQPLPSKYTLKSTCWISNISIAPVYFKANLFSPPVSKKIELTKVNFNINTEKINTNSDIYTNLNDNGIEDIQAVLNTLKSNLNDLYIDYTDFSNFIIYSSAELRTRLAKNKIQQYYSDQDKKEALKYAMETTNKPSIKESYQIEIIQIENEQIESLKTFDEYESYLLFYTSNEYIESRIIDGIAYDKINKDSLINQLPTYIQSNSESSDYIKFVSMIGHFFDTIYLYIKKFPKTYSPYDPGYPKMFLDEFLNSQNWSSLNRYFENSNIFKFLHNKDHLENGQSLSYYDYGKEILNRFVNNLPYIYKTTGTRESLRLLESIFGIPHEILQIREYGSSDITANIDNFYDYDSFVYLTKFKPNNYITFQYEYDDFSNIGGNDKIIDTSINTIEFSFKIDTSVAYKSADIISLFENRVKPNTPFAEVNWDFCIRKESGKYLGRIIFTCYNINDNQNIIFQLKSDILPIFNGNLYTVVLTRSEIFEDLTQTENQNIHAVFNKKYTLYVNQFDGYLCNFNSVKSNVLTHTYSNKFSKGYYYVGGFYATQQYNTRLQFTGNLDKIKIYKRSLTPEDVNEHSYNIDSISITNKDTLYSDLLFLWSFDTPIDISIKNKISGYVTVPNCNTYWKDNIGIGEDPDKYNFKAYNFEQVLKKIVYDYPECKEVYVPKFPYQFDIAKLKQAINANNYGPNYKNNIKINKIDERATTIFTPYDCSTEQLTRIGKDSNLIGVFISPTLYLEKCIENFLGKEGISEYISNPINLYKKNYDELKKQSDNFIKINKKYILPNEYYLTYKLYIDFSVFDYITKLLPNRVSLKRGLLVEPTQFERKKINIKKIYNDMSYDSTYVFDLKFTRNDIIKSSLILKNEPTFSFVEPFTNIITNADNTTTGLIVSSNKTHKQDKRLCNYTIPLIPDVRDDRTFICYSDNNVYCNVEDTFCIYKTLSVKDEYNCLSQLDNGQDAVFNLTTTRLELVDYDPIDLSASYDSFENFYPNNIVHRHLKNFNHVGSRTAYVACKDNNKLVESYNYIKGKNDNKQTINRNGLYNGSEPVISIPGFLSLRVLTNESSQYGYVTQTSSSIDETLVSNMFVKVPLTASLENSSSLEMCIYNL